MPRFLNKTAFLTDLDGTLIFSKNTAKQWLNNETGELINGTKLTDNAMCIEHYNEKPLSYISETTCGILSKLSSQIDIAPVTTRTMLQYERIKLPFNVSTAFVANGSTAIDCRNNRIHTLMEQSDDILQRLRRYKEKYAPVSVPDWVKKTEIADNTFVYIVCHTCDSAQIIYNTVLSNPHADDIVTVSGRKVYIIPHSVTKAIAVERLRPHYCNIIAAGDAELDIPMLLQSDYAIVPTIKMRDKLKDEMAHGLWNGYKSPVKNIFCKENDTDDLFSDYIAHTLSRLNNTL